MKKGQAADVKTPNPQQNKQTASGLVKIQQDTHSLTICMWSTAGVLSFIIEIMFLLHHIKTFWALFLCLSWNQTVSTSLFIYCQHEPGFLIIVIRHLCFFWIRRAAVCSLLLSLMDFSWVWFEIMILQSDVFFCYYSSITFIPFLCFFFPLVHQGSASAFICVRQHNHQHAVTPGNSWKCVQGTEAPSRGRSNWAPDCDGDGDGGEGGARRSEGNCGTTALL